MEFPLSDKLQQQHHLARPSRGARLYTSRIEIPRASSRPHWRFRFDLKNDDAVCQFVDNVHTIAGIQINFCFGRCFDEGAMDLSRIILYPHTERFVERTFSAGAILPTDGNAILFSSLMTFLAIALGSSGEPEAYQRPARTMLTIVIWYRNRLLQRPAQTSLPKASGFCRLASS